MEEYGQMDILALWVPLSFPKGSLSSLGRWQSSEQFIGQPLLCHSSNFSPPSLVSVETYMTLWQHVQPECSSVPSDQQLLKVLSPTILPCWMLSWGWNPSDRTAWALPHSVTVPGTSPMANTHVATQLSCFSETWARASYTHRIRSAPANCRPAFQRTRHCSQHLEERLIIVHRSSCSHTHNYPVFTCKYPSAHGFFGKCQLHRCNPGAQIWELGIERCTQALSRLWTGIIIIISPNGYVCHSITMVDDSVSLPRLFTPLPQLTPLIRKPATSHFTVLPTPPPTAF